MHQTELLIYETFLDSFGHVNNAKYLELYEQARWNWLLASGMDTQYIRQTGIGPVILNLQLSFLQELLPRQVIVIQSICEAQQKKIVTIKQQMHIKSSGQLASELTLTAGLMDLKARKLIPPPPEWLKAFGLTV